MARNKEQWKAEKRAQHTQTQSKGFFQMKRPLSHTPGVRSTAPPASSALFQLGRPTNRAPVVAGVRPAVLKPDPIQTPSQSGSSSGQAIDLTLDDDDEEEDEPMGAQQSVTTAATAATVSSAASDAVKLSMLDGNKNEDTAATRPLQQTSDMVVPIVEDNESDVDEDWPVVPSITSSPMPIPLASSVHDLATLSTSQSVSLPTTTPVSEQDSHSQTQKDVGAALDAIRKAIPFSQEGQEGNDPERNTQVEATRQQTSMPPLYGDGDDGGMDVDEDLPSQAREAGEDTTECPSTSDRIVEVENLEDGEIFEEGAAPRPTMQVQQTMMRGNRPGLFDAYSVDAMGIRSHQRIKKQKKRGKKKSKRKLEAMQMMHAPPGEIIPDFERTTRQRPFGDAPPPGQYTLAMMRNGSGPRDNAMNVRPVFRDPPPAPFQPGRPVVGGMYPPMRPPPQQLQNPPMPPPPPFEDSQILRVNRQGSMEMLGGEAERPLHAIFAEPPMQRGFKYRPVSISALRPIPSGASHSLQRSVSDQSPLPPIPHQSRAAISSPIPNKERDGSEDVDLDSLRAAALRSKVTRSLKTSTSTSVTPAVTEVDSSFSSSSSSSPPKPAHNEEKRSVSEPASPKSENELRLEILRSMTRNRKRAVSKAHDAAQVPTPPVGESNAVENPEQSSGCANAAGEDGDNVANEKPSAPQTDSTAAEKSSKATLPKASDVSDIELMVIDRSSTETDKSTSTSEQNGTGDQAKTPSARVLESAKPSGEPAVTTPEFRPLTACSQSLVIRLSPEDFSPREGGDNIRTKSTASSSLQDAIKEMRRKIAEREKEQSNRLLENAAATVSKHPSGTSSSPASLSCTPHQLSPKKVSTVVALVSGASEKSPEVRSSAIDIAKKPPPGAVAEEAQRATASIDAQASVSEDKENPLKLPTEIGTGANSPETPVVEIQERGDTSAGVSTIEVTDDVRAENSCNAPIIEEPNSTDALIPGKGELDFDAIRADFKSCCQLRRRWRECKDATLQRPELEELLFTSAVQSSPGGLNTSIGVAEALELLYAVGEGGDVCS
ncbi:hypothetical protein PI126_g12583 [Phytophthora idaei]|nr:hypothetical protein PI126_g12583 [Phytophthora idaei]